MTNNRDGYAAGVREIALNDARGRARIDLVAVEEPLEIRLRHRRDDQPDERSISITMRTPGADRELAQGFLFTEGIIHSRQEIAEVETCGPVQQNGIQNSIRVELKPEVQVNVDGLLRNFYATSSCGVCGKASLQALYTQSAFAMAPPRQLFKRADLQAAPGKLRAEQSLFGDTGGLHAAGLMNREGELVACYEDVGRHNALDKLIGHCLGNDLIPLHSYAVILSGRASFELMQKSMMAGCGVVAAVGAPSSLAVDCAREYGMTLLGFVNERQSNLYHLPDRLL